MTPSQHPHAPQVQFEPEDVRIQELEWEAQDEDVLATARACIGAREFLRAVHLLRDGKSAKARFLSIYSQFMVG
jgi:anaphase-promoting complex subunit 8